MPTGSKRWRDDDCSGEADLPPSDASGKEDGCSTSVPYGGEGITSVFDDDLAWDRDQVAEMRGSLNEE